MIETSVTKQESLPPYDVGSKYALTPSEETLRKLGDHLLNRLTRLKQVTDRSNWEKTKVAAFNAYHMVPKARTLPFPGAANMASPLARIGVDSFHANVMSSIYTNDNRMSVVPLITSKDFASTAKKAADYMTYVMNHEADSYNVIDDADKKAQMFGVGYLEPSYVKEESWDTVEVTKTEQKATVGADGQPQIVSHDIVTKEKKKRTIFDGIKLHSLPVDSIFVSPLVLSLEQGQREDVVFKTGISKNWGDIKNRAKEKEGRAPFYIKKQIDKLQPVVNKSVIRNFTELDLAKAAVDGFYVETLAESETIELAEAYLWYDIDGDDIKEEIKVTFEPSLGTVVRVALSTCRIVEIVPRPVDGRFYGEGIPKVAESCADEWENFHNTRANAGQWENTTFGFYRAGGRFNPSTITVQPGRFYPVDDPREVQFAQPPRTGMSYFQEEQLIVNYFERITGLDENMQGVGSSRRRTATESINLSSRSSIRFSNPFNRIITQLNKVLNHVWELNQECAPEEKEFFIVGEGGVPMFDQMKKYDFGAKMKFGLSVSSVFDQQLNRDTMLLAYRMFMTNPGVANHPEIMWKLSQQTLDALRIDLELPKPPEADTLSPFEEHELFLRGENPEPAIGEDTKHHLKVHETVISSPEFNEWTQEAQAALILHRDKTVILQKTLESANLNKSGVFPVPATAQNQPSFTANRNPTQTFNTARVGETGASMKQNTQNGQGGQNAQALDAAFGNSVS